MINFFRFKRDIPFMRYSKLTNVVSVVVFLMAVLSLSIKGLNYSIEFTGGTILELRFEKPVDVEDLRRNIVSLGIGAVQVQSLGTNRDILVRVQTNFESSPGLSDSIMNLLSDAELRKFEFIGAQVGDELFSSGLTAFLIVIAGIVMYLAFRFEWRFAVSAIIANLHDVVVVIGFFSFFEWEFSLTVLAAVLAVLGYSVNESVVVFDRIRENFRKPAMRGVSVPDIIDNAITATISRTVITHGSTEFVVLAMLIFGGETLYYFALALTIGIVFGIYSSVLVASPLLLWFRVNPENLIKVKKSKEEIVV